ncbi:hypothetical protein K490DRAFT_58131 [Saccharata proteae CBS 121410]|uniref:Nuclear envelope protein n=1 Tax=Saccharata proteae CBS 121410 TaxID=1314787 RepID=A0A9P4HUB2_9PEZI|nr:hypothetical protein K490DRAFT_58131 [Saccharata proteae CBS 121410]
MSARAPPPAAKPRPYRNFLTPFLHRQYMSATVLSLGACYVAAICIGSYSGLIGTFLPIFRTLILIISVHAVYVIRVSQWHVGTRTTNSKVETFWQYAFQPATLNTIFWYSVSAFLFIETYMWSQPTESKFGFIDQGKTYERPRMNERPIYLRAMFLILGIFQAGFHLYHDYDRIQLPRTKFGVSTAVAQPAYKQLFQNSKVKMVNGILTRVVFLLVGGNMIYMMFRTYIVWNWVYWLMRGWYTFLPKTGKPTYWPGFGLAVTVLWEGFVLCALWEFANQAFTTFISQEPLKNGNPITNDSKDPNGSLLIGLKAKKDLPKNMAFWELAIISQRFEARRATLFSELEGSTWKQVLELCLGEITAIKARIEALKPSLPASDAELLQQKLELDRSALPRISDTPLKDDPIFGKAPEPQGEVAHGVKYIADFAKRQGQQPYYKGGSPVKRVLALTESKKLQVQQTPFARKHTLSFLEREVGIPFRQTFARRATAVITGTPYSRINIIANAVTAVSQLVAHSLKEDVCGTVKDDIARIVRTIAGVILAVDTYLANYKPHWTDVWFTMQNSIERNRFMGEVRETREVLKAGLKGVVEAFNEYLPNMGLSEKEIREVKELVDGKKDGEVEMGGERRHQRPEMHQGRR